MNLRAWARRLLWLGFSGTVVASLWKISPGSAIILGLLLILSQILGEWFSEQFAENFSKGLM